MLSSANSPSVCRDKGPCFCVLCVCPVRFVALFIAAPTYIPCEGIPFSWACPFASPGPSSTPFVKSTYSMLPPRRFPLDICYPPPLLFILFRSPFPLQDSENRTFRSFILPGKRIKFSKLPQQASEPSHPPPLLSVPATVSCTASFLNAPLLANS